MNGILKKFKNFGMLEFLVIASAAYIIIMLVWTLSSRSGLEEKIEIVRKNHIQIVELINSEINKCDRADENSNTAWGDPCKSEWVADNVIKYVLENLKLTNPYSANSPVIKSTTDPRLQAEGQAGQSTEMGVIFVTSADFMSEPGSEWMVGTCFKSPCVAAGNNELTSIYR